MLKSIIIILSYLFTKIFWEKIRHCTKKLLYLTDHKKGTNKVISYYKYSKYGK